MHYHKNQMDLHQYQELVHQEGQTHQGEEYLLQEHPHKSQTDLLK